MSQACRVPGAPIKIDSHTWQNRVIFSAERLITRSSMFIFILDSGGVLASCLYFSGPCFPGTAVHS